MMSKGHGGGSRMVYASKTKPPGRGTSGQPSLTTNRTVLVVAALAVIAIAIAAGYLLGHHTRDDHRDVQVTGTFTGTIALVNHNTTGGICVTPDNGGQQRCGVQFATADYTPEVGQHVNVAVEKINDTHDGSYEAFVIYPDNAPTG